MTTSPSTAGGPPAGNGFATLALSPQMLANLTQLGYTQMTAIQAAALPPALLGKDLIAQAKTGSGKTAAFALALLSNFTMTAILERRESERLWGRFCTPCGCGGCGGCFKILRYLESVSYGLLYW
jgi:superfamily II DNA/RNA helicase